MVNLAPTLKILTQARAHALQIVLLVVACMLATKLMGGERGFVSYLDRQYEQKQAQKTLESLSAERIALESRVLRMQAESFDSDLLEEQAKKILGLSHPDERVIALP